MLEVINPWWMTSGMVCACPHTTHPSKGYHKLYESNHLLILFSYPLECSIYPCARSIAIYNYEPIGMRFFSPESWNSLTK